MTQLPPLPVAPAASSTAEERAAFYDQVAAYDLALRAVALEQAAAAQATRERHAQAQADTAAAMAASAEAQRGFTTAMREPEPQPPLAELKRRAVLELLGRQPRGSKSPAAHVADVTAQVNAVFAIATTAAGAA